MEEKGGFMLEKREKIEDGFFQCPVDLLEILEELGVESKRMNVSYVVIWLFRKSEAGKVEISPQELSWSTEYSLETSKKYLSKIKAILDNPLKAPKLGDLSERIIFVGVE